MSNVICNLVARLLGSPKQPKVHEETPSNLWAQPETLTPEPKPIEGPKQPKSTPTKRRQRPKKGPTRRRAR